MNGRAIVVAAFLLVPGATFGQSAQTHWIADARTGCRVSSEADLEHLPVESVTWSGACPNGLAQGPGSLDFFEDKGFHVHYDGEVLDGKLSGHGVLTDHFGRWEGEWRDGKRNGHVLLTSPEGSHDDGEWRDDQEIHSVYMWPNGIRYDGEVGPHGRNGHGVLTWPRSGWLAWGDNRYDGDWGDSLPNGQGVAVINGQTYNGLWVNGCFRSGDKLVAFGWPLVSSCR